MNDSGLIKRTAAAIRGSVTFKMFVVGFLILVLLIPVFMVQSLIDERQDRRSAVVTEVSEKWGKDQIIAGPVLTIPYRKYFVKQNGQRTYETRYAHFLPKRLDISGRLHPEIRYRGIYKVVLHNAKLTLGGHFDRPDFAALDIAEQNVLWQRAFVSLGIADMKGIREGIALDAGQVKVAMAPGIETNDVLSSGVSTRIPASVAHGRSVPFSLKIDLNGSDRIQFVPTGETTQVRLASSWKTPSFIGDFLPVDREVNNEGFTAKWKVLHLNRNYPQSWTGSKHKILGSAFGVKLLVAADIYQQATRTAKYAALFIVLTFTTFFFAEIVARRRLHPIQYLLIGLALIVFYSLLIALSEHIRFSLAYLIASTAVIVLVTGYAKSALENNRLVALVGGVLIILYGYLYMILQLEDYALLMGSIGLFAALATVMYLTRKIDWYASPSPGGE